MSILKSEWKNVTFAIGLAMLIYGAVTLDYPDWDINISILMAGFTYLSADRLIKAIKDKNILKSMLLSVAAWWSIDGVYWLYWSLVDTSVMIREGQWLASLCLYLLCGMIWNLHSSESHPKPQKLFYQ